MSNPPGWYPEPSSGLQRWWDGSSWGPYAPTTQARPSFDSAALASIVFAAIGFLLSAARVTGYVAIPIGIIGLVLALVALRNIRASRTRGTGLAATALVLALLQAGTIFVLARS